MPGLSSGSLSRPAYIYVDIVNSTTGWMGRGSIQRQRDFANPRSSPFPHRRSSRSCHRGPKTLQESPTLRKLSISGDLLSVSRLPHSWRLGLRCHLSPQGTWSSASAMMRYGSKYSCAPQYRTSRDHQTSSVIGGFSLFPI